MPDANTTLTDHRSQVHTEVRTPIEVTLSRVATYVFGVIEILIGIRFVLKLLGANADAGFVQMMYAVSGFFMAPFDTVFGVQRVSGSTFELSAIVAIAVYALLGFGVVKLIRTLSPREHSETVERVVKDDDVTTTP